MSQKDKRPEKNLWQQFRGKKNTKDALTEKAKTLATLVILFASEDTKSLLEQLKKDGDQKDDRFSDVFFEMILFYLHFIDRIAFQYLKIDQRNIFANVLVAEVKRLLSLTLKNAAGAAKLNSIFAEMYNNRQKEYAQHKKLFAEKDEGLKDTLFWEFGKKIADTLGLAGGGFVVIYTQIIAHSLIALELPELFTE